MQRHIIRFRTMLMFAALCGLSPGPSAAQQITAATVVDPAPAQPPTDASSLVKPAGPGVFVQQKQGAVRFHLSLMAKKFTSREAIEEYLAWRAAQLTAEQGYSWFAFVEHREKGDKVPASKSAPSGLRYSFRLESFRPLWRYKLVEPRSAWKIWSPFSGAPFWADGLDAKSVAAYAVSADIVLHKGRVEGDNPLAFDAGALSDFLVNQVQPPE